VAPSETSCGSGFDVAQEERATSVATNKSGGAIFGKIILRTSIDHSVTGLHLHTAWQAAGNDIADGSGWFN